MSDSTILVTGGAGFVGSHFARYAAEAGRRVIVLDDLSGGIPVQPPDGVPLLLGDIGDEAYVRKICREHHVGAIAHFAGKIQVGESVVDPALYFEVNVVRTLTLLRSIQAEGVRACLFSSTAAVYGNPTHVPIPETARTEPVNPYGATKLAIEHALAAWGTAYALRWAALRYFNAAGAHPDGSLCENYEPETHLIPLAIDAAMDLRPPLKIFGDDYDTPDGTCIRDYIHVQDLASAHLSALTRLERGEQVGALNLGTGTGFSVREVIAAVGRVLGRDVPCSVAPRRAGDPPRLVADPSRALEVLNWQAKRTAIVDIVEDAVRARVPAARRESST